MPFRIPIIHKLTEGESTAENADTALESAAETVEEQTNDVNKPEETEDFGNTAAESNIVPQYVEFGKPSMPVKKIKKPTVNHIISTNKKPIADKMGTGEKNEDNKGSQYDEDGAEDEESAEDENSDEEFDDDSEDKEDLEEAEEESEVGMLLFIFV